MNRSASAPHRFEALLPQGIMGAGAISVVVFLILFLTRTPGLVTTFPERSIEVLLLAVPAVGLCYAGYWLHTCEVSVSEAWQIGWYAIGGTIIGVLIGSVLITAVAPVNLDALTLIFYFVSTGTEGALLGFLIGTITVTDLLFDRGPAHNRQSAHAEEFAAILVHDLRNPLNVAEGRLALAQEVCDSPHLDAVTAAHDRMYTLLDDLLLVARATETTPNCEPVDLNATASECWKTVATVQARLAIETDRTIQADPSLLHHLFENLFRNAVEQADQYVDVTVTVGTLDDGTGFYVADDGPGIPPAERENVFEAGYTTRPDGTGFGLHIVKQIAEAHDWDVTVSESEAGGARFEFTDVKLPGT